jgi:uncharacterized protein
MDSVLLRQIAPLVTELASGFRVLILNGPRQSGKSTLLSQLHAERGGTLLTLDDVDALRASRTDPRGFVTGYPTPLFIDEVQRGGDPLVLSVKADADRNPSDFGRFILAGSSRFLTVPNLTESLAGRATIVDVWPFSQSELHGGNDRFLDLAFESPDSIRALRVTTLTRAEIANRIVQGGFPAVRNMNARLRDAWFDTYLRTLTDRDLAEYRRPNRTVDVGRLTQLILGRTAQEVNASNIASDLALTADTVRNYLSLTETIYLHHQLPAWTGGQTGRIIKRHKLHAIDTGLAAYVLNATSKSMAVPTSAVMGPLFETFVVNEIAKQRTWSNTSARLFHYREPAGAEIDLILEARGGAIVAIEIKGARDVDEQDFRHLAALRDRLGSRFINGIVVHLGERPMSFGDRLTALPVSALWEA